MVVLIVDEQEEYHVDPEEIEQFHPPPPRSHRTVDECYREKHWKISKLYEKILRWWEKQSLKFAFIHPHVKSRLERLMESNVVSLTDRTYMIQLSRRIIEDYVESMEKRIKTREVDEMERIKNLILTDQIPKSQAPLSMAKHPVMLIEKHCNKLIEERRKKIKIPKVHIPTHLYYDDTPDPPSGLSIEKGHHYRMHSERLCNPITQFVSVEISELDNETKLESPAEPLSTKDVEINEMPEKKTETEPQAEEQFDALQFGEDLIEILKTCNTVEEIYKLADAILGEFKSLADEDTFSTITAMSELRSAIIPDNQSIQSEASVGGGEEKKAE